MEDCPDFIPLLKPGDLVFFWKGHDIWRLAMFDEVTEEGRFAFITRLEPDTQTRLKLTPDRLYGDISTSLVPLTK